MSKWLVLILLLGILVFPTQAGAQGGVNLKSVNVELWSEYDQPSMLVIHEFTVHESTALPAKVSVRFPKDGNLTAVAYLDGTLINSDYDGPESQGTWQTVTLNVEKYVPYRIEYYQPLTRKGNQRSFIYQWFGDYPVKEFRVATQIPADRTDVNSTPPFNETGTSQDGKGLVGVVTQSDLTMGQSSDFSISYQRESESVTQPSNTGTKWHWRPSRSAGRLKARPISWVR